MFFVGSRTSANLAFTTPPEFCCNCGASKGLVFVDTPLQRTRYFLFFGTELTLTESFPYCRRCKGSAKRVQLSWLGKMLATCLVTSVVFLAMVFLAESLPKAISANLFRSSLILSIGLSLAYFYLQEWRRRDRSHYQPVSLVDAKLDSNSLSQITLRFFNQAYAQVFKKANAELFAAGIIKIETRK